MDFVALVSGGKDSLFSAHFLVSQGWSLTALVCARPSDPDSYMFHTVNLDTVKTQAEAIGVPLYELHVGGEKEREVEEFAGELIALKRELGVNNVSTGAVYSEYQRARFDEVFERSGYRCFMPLWHKRPELLLSTYLDQDFVFILSGVYAMGLSDSELARILDRTAVDRLLQLARTYRFSPVGEGGEYESLVLDCPLFRNSVFVEGYKKIGRSRAEFVVTHSSLVEKGRAGVHLLEN